MDHRRVLSASHLRKEYGAVFAVDDVSSRPSTTCRHAGWLSTTIHGRAVRVGLIARYSAENIS